MEVGGFCILLREFGLQETLPSHPGARWQEQRWEGDVARMGWGHPPTREVHRGGRWLSSSEVTIPAEEKPLAPEHSQGREQGSAGAGQSPDPCGHISVGNVRCSWRPSGRGLLSLESCRAAQEHGLRTDLLHHEIPSPATVGATSCNPLQKSYRFLAAFHISSSPPHLLEV